jgi:protease I
MRLQNLRVAFIIADEFEDLEHHVPRMRLLEEGAEVLVAGKTAGEYRGKGGLGARAGVATSDLDPAAFHGAVVPGGWAPDKVRRDPHALGFLRALNERGAVLGFICHAGWVASSAGLIRPGAPVTGSLGIRDDLEARGARWLDQAAFRDGNLVWGRVVADIPPFCRELVAALEDRGR